MYPASLVGGETSQWKSLRKRIGELAGRSRVTSLFSALVSLALLIAAAHQMRGFDLDDVAGLVPETPLFWTVFASWYLAGPVSEWVIYRKLWGIPAAGLSALMRKMITNELLLGYLGEAQFYAWARSRLKMEAAPFGAIKDVTILSALTGNVATLLMLLLTLPVALSGGLSIGMQTTFLSLGVILLTSLAILLLRHKLFSLRPAELHFIAAIHAARIAVKIMLGAWLWSLVLPQVALSQWLILSTLRMLVSRLPLMPNKDVAFAAIGIILVGHDLQLASVLAMIGGLVLIAHAMIGAGFALLELRRCWDRG